MTKNVLNRKILTVAVILASIIFCEMTIADLTFTWQRLTRAEVDALFANPDATVVATGQFRAGDTTAPEIRAQNGEMDLGQPFDSGNLTWDIGEYEITGTDPHDGHTIGHVISWGHNSLSAGYGTPELAGFFQIEAMGISNTTDSANSLPTMWYNSVLLDVSSQRAIIDIIGDINGESFNLNVDPSVSDTYDAILVTFSNTEGTTPVWDMSANMSMTTPYPALFQDDFRVDVTLIQNTNLPPLTAFDILVAQVANGNSTPANINIITGGSTNITHTADAYYYLEQTVHEFGTVISTNTYGVGSNTVVETIVNVQTNGVITPTFSPYVTTSEQIPHWWLAQHYGHTNDFDSLEGTDTDGDGIDIADEYALGFNPLTNEPPFDVAMGVSTSGVIPALQFETHSNRLYHLRWSTNVMLPFVSHSTYTGTGQRLTINLTNPPPTYFKVDVSTE